jgi:hypothetical protein
MLLAGLAIWAAGMIHLRATFPPTTVRLAREFFGFPVAEVFSGLSATVGFAVLSQADVPLANRLSSPDVAASYAAVAVLGKAILYLPGGVATALFPMVAAVDKQTRASVSLLYQSIIITTLGCGLVATAYSLIGKQLVVMVYGSRYPAAPALLQHYGWVMLPLAVTFLLNNYFVALSRLLYPWFVCAAAVLLIGLGIAFPLSPTAILQTMGLLGTLLCLGGLWLARFQHPDDSQPNRS